ncbi:MAG: lipoyl(octanoyl) transferase LipB [Fimbriimonadaceae bacterium]|nr:lipoyl(octanoyl) transferase LipB [Fimbriimonadaceae bacterium]
MEVVDWGRVSFREAYERQVAYVEEVQRGVRPDTLVFVEHDPVFTLGANFHEENLLLPRDEYAARGFEVVATDRGGDVTYHGPGQLVAYPIFDLNRRGRDLHRWLRDLEEVVIRTLAEFGIEGRRLPPHTGVWVGDRKIAAIGIKVRRWVSFHGIALNVTNDLSPFDLIVPCGIRGFGVTGMAELMGVRVNVAVVRAALAGAFRRGLG